MTHLVYDENRAQIVSIHTTQEDAWKAATKKAREEAGLKFVLFKSTHEFQAKPVEIAVNVVKAGN